MSELVLVRYDAACRALAAARSIDEVKDILDLAIAMGAYARQAKNKDLEADAYEIRRRAERGLDEKIRAQAAAIGLSKGTRGQLIGPGIIGGLREHPPTLAAAGIDQNLAHRARQVGALSKLNWANRGMSEPLAHRHYDTFELPEAPDRLLPDGLAISFSTDRKGNVASLAAPFEPLVKDIVFTRIAAGDCTKSGLPSALHRHVQPGSYDGRCRAGQ